MCSSDLYPLSGWRIVLGELLAPTAILSGLLWLALLALFVMTGRAADLPGWLTPTVRLAGTACIGVLIPPVCMLQLLVPNAGTVLFPSWSQAGRPTRGGGIEVMGQRLIFVAGQLLVLLAAVLPASGFAVLAGFAASLTSGPAVSFAIAAATLLLALGAEIAAGVYWLGHRFERFDLSAEALK